MFRFFLVVPLSSQIWMLLSLSMGKIPLTGAFYNMSEEKGWRNVRWPSCFCYFLKFFQLKMFNMPRCHTFGWHVLNPIILFFSFIFISWRLITLQYCSGFCHTLTWISHGFTSIPHPDTSSPPPSPPASSGSSQGIRPEHLYHALTYHSFSRSKEFKMKGIFLLNL